MASLWEEGEQIEGKKGQKKKTNPVETLLLWSLCTSRPPLLRSKLLDSAVTILAELLRQGTMNERSHGGKQRREDVEEVGKGW
jgi:hypothetical protein